MIKKLVDENPDIRDKYILCVHGPGMDRMDRFIYDDLNRALDEGERRNASEADYTYLYLYDNWNQKVIKRWTGWFLNDHF